MVSDWVSGVMTLVIVASFLTLDLEETMALNSGIGKSSVCWLLFLKKKKHETTQCRIKKKKKHKRLKRTLFKKLDKTGQNADFELKSYLSSYKHYKNKQ